MQSQSVIEESNTLLHAAASGRRRFFRFLPLLVLFICLGITWQLWDSATQNAEQEVRNYFDFRVRQAVELTKQRMTAQEQVLRSARGLFAASKNVERAEFRNYVASLRLEENYPGIQGVGFALAIPPAQLAKHTAAIRQEGFQQYSVHPPGQRDIYTSIIYLEPFDWRNQRAFGYDMYSEPVRRAAMARARDSGEASLSGKVKLVQETEKDVQAGFLIYLPVYRNGLPHETLEERRTNLVGWVYSPLRMNDFAQGMYGERATDLDIEIYDGDHASPDTLLYDTTYAHEDRASLILSATQQLSFGGHTWTILIHAMPDLQSRVVKTNPNNLLLVGVTASLLLTWLAWLLTTGRERALNAALQMNRELLASEVRYRMLVEASPFCIHEVGLDGNFQSMNRAGLDMLGLENGKAILGTSYLDRVSQQDKERVMELMHGALLGNSSHFEFISSSNPPRHFKSCFIPLRNPQGKVQKLMGISEDITDRKLAEEILKKSAAEIEDLYNHAPCGYHSLDKDGFIQKINDTELEWLGYQREEVIGKIRFTDWLTAAGIKTFQENFPHFKSAGRIDDLEIEIRLRNGAIRHWLVNAAAIYDEHGDFLMSRSSVFDITDRKLAEETIAHNEANMRAILDNIPYLVWLKDTDSRFVAVNHAFLRSTGRASMDEVIGKTDFDLWPEHLARKYREDDIDVMVRRLQKLTEEQSLDNGTVSWVETFKAPILDRNGRLLGTTGFARDITERKLAQELVQHMAHHDALTDLPNRALFADRLQQALAAARRDKLHLALMFIDLDKFKPINDELGHEIGDLLLKEVAWRMQHCVRESDTVARIGGDEFVVLLPVIEEVQDALRVAEKIRHALNQPFEISGNSLNISSSTGIAVYPEHGSIETELMKNADVAMYHAKQGGRNSVVLYRPDMQDV